MQPIQPPEPVQLSQLQKLCEYATPFASNAELNGLFVDAFKEIIAWHKVHNPFYAALLEQQHCTASQLDTIDDLAKVPYIHANFFKRHESLSVARETITEHLTSSGTSGQKSQMFFDDWSIRSARRMVGFIYDTYGFHTPEEPANYLLFAYEPLPDFTVGTTNTNIFLTSFARPNGLFFALRQSGGKHEFDRFGTVRTLQEYAEQDLPVRIHGFPSFAYFTLRQMEEMKIRLSLHPDSLVMFGGGWKGYANEEIPKKRLYDLIHETLGIAPERIRDAYGSVEHSIPYIECSKHRLHIPVWSRLFIRDITTLEVQGYGKPGFMNFVTPYITSVPAVSVMMGDLGVMHPPSVCSCGAQTPCFEVLGRAGVSRNKSCAVSASELLKKKGVYDG
ncbi:LuxE/PaaK family acyltransferase [Desulfogranum mediterraneum]|uniref:LuxE/PaaK family acyltransferase n=1 Tax=Desulfogranum mediterraneum TaxID=160661 RepID=UPI000417EF4C|nr:acyl-protein synthase [Desulfogranum mediterraneum]